MHIGNGSLNYTRTDYFYFYTGVEVWSFDEVTDTSDSEFEITPEVPPDIEPLQQDNHGEDAKTRALTSWFMVFIFLLQAKYHLTNQVICLVLKFLKTFLEVLGRFSTFCYNVAKNIPPTMYKAMKIQKNYVNFKRFVSCKRCHTIYCFND